VSSENTEAEIPNAAISPPVKVGTRNSDRSSIGRCWAASMNTKAASSAPAALRLATTFAEPQPSPAEISP